MFKQLVFSISISLLAMLTLHCGDPAGQKTEADDKKSGQMERVKNAWANVEAKYHKRAEVIFGLIKTMKVKSPRDSARYKDVEQILRSADSSGIISNGKEISKMNIDEYFHKQADGPSKFVGLMLEGRLDDQLAVSFQSSLEEAELDIMKARKKYNEAAKDYNKSETDINKQLPLIL